MNVDLGRSFYDYINEQRIAEVQRELRRSDRAVLDLALEVGFNNKSTFNKGIQEGDGHHTQCLAPAGASAWLKSEPMETYPPGVRIGRCGRPGPRSLAPSTSRLCIGV